jgi:hypothetical protein
MVIVVGAAVALAVANCGNRSGIVPPALDFWTIAVDCLELAVDHFESVFASFTGTEAVHPMLSIVEGARQNGEKLGVKRKFFVRTVSFGTSYVRHLCPVYFGRYDIRSTTGTALFCLMSSV